MGTGREEQLGGEIGLDEVELESPVDARWLALFEDRHGAGSYQRLRSLLEQPCLTFAKVAEQFGVTRERVRQWHLVLMPNAPRGHERQRLCGRLQQRKRLLEDPLFRSFFQHARRQVERGRIELLRSAQGYRTRIVRIDGRSVAIADLSRSVKYREGREGSPTRIYTVRSQRRTAEFIYLRLSEGDYLFVPTVLLPDGRAAFADDSSSRFSNFKNTFDALTTTRDAGPTDASPALSFTTSWK